MSLPESFFDSILRASMITASCAIAPRIQPGPVVSLRACLHGDFGSLAMAATGGDSTWVPSPFCLGVLGVARNLTYGNQAFTMQNLRNKDLRMSQYEVALGVWH